MPGGRKLETIFAKFQPGQVIGHSEWLQVTQQMLDQFGECTLDPDPMHIDPEWARENSPFSSTIAFGFWTTSVLTYLLHSALKADISREPAKYGYYLNYGFDRLRLVAPVPVNGRIRGYFCVIDVRADEGGRTILTFACEIEIEGKPRPALVADWLAVWVPGWVDGKVKAERPIAGMLHDDGNPSISTD